MSEFKLNARTPRELGMDAFNEGKLFSDCPYEGMQPEDIDLRWTWQLGWLRAQQDKWDAEKINKPKDK